MPREWIAVITVDDEVEQKLRRKHHITSDQVREAVIPDAYDEGHWETDPVYGRRYFVTGVAEDVGPLLALLRPQGDDIWRLLTAYPLS